MALKLKLDHIRNWSIYWSIKASLCLYTTAAVLLHCAVPAKSINVILSLLSVASHSLPAARSQPSRHYETTVQCYCVVNFVFEVVELWPVISLVRGRRMSKPSLMGCWPWSLRFTMDETSNSNWVLLDMRFKRKKGIKTNLREENYQYKLIAQILIVVTYNNNFECYKWCNSSIWKDLKKEKRAVKKSSIHK